VAGGAVEAEQLAALGQVAVLEVARRQRRAAASWSISSSENTGGLFAASASWRVSGMRPVCTWK
jgi:hypothetical protein